MRAHFIKGSAGGKATAVKLRQSAIDSYYTDPNICKFCGKIIEINGNLKVAQARRKLFCSRSCASKFNNLGRRKNAVRTCKQCGQEFEVCRTAKGILSVTEYCKACKHSNALLSKTKGDIFRQYPYNWAKARAVIAKHARTQYVGPDICKICGYHLRIDICHIVPVAEFGDNAMLSDINCNTNLIALCPNHHFEFDAGLLEVRDAG